MKVVGLASVRADSKVVNEKPTEAVCGKIEKFFILLTKNVPCDATSRVRIQKNNHPGLTS